MKKEYDPEPPVNEYLKETVEQTVSKLNKFAPKFFEKLKRAFDSYEEEALNEYKSITAQRYDELKSYNDKMISIYSAPLDQIDTEINKNKEEFASYFTNYVCILILSQTMEIVIETDFYNRKRKKRYFDLEVNSYTKSKSIDLDRFLNIQKSALSKISKYKTLRDSPKRKPTSLMDVKEYPDKRPQEFFNIRDAELLETLMRKLIHTDCFLHAYEREKKTGKKYQKGPRGLIKEIINIIERDLEILFQLFKSLGIKNADSARFLFQLQGIMYASYGDHYENVDEDILYKQSSLAQKIKIDFKFSPEKIKSDYLLPKIGNYYHGT